MNFMNFETARMIVMYVVIHDIFLEQIEMAEDLGSKPSYAEYDSEVFDILVANKDKNPLTHILDFTEKEIVYACRNVWTSFT